MTHHSRYGLILPLLLLGACAQQPAEREPAERIPVEPPLPVETTPEMLADLLVAEVAAQRNALHVTLGYYSKVALASNDPAALEQAARLAAYLREHQQALTLAERWLRQSPDNARAAEIAALAAISLGEVDRAAAHIDTLMARDPNAALADLVEQARNLGEQTNEPLLAALSSLVEHYPDQAPLWYARALHLQNQGQLEPALEACERALKRQRNHQEALLLKGRLLADLGREDEARSHLAKLVKKFPDARRVRVQYARLLITTGRHQQARKQLETLAERFPESPELRFSLALFALEEEAYDNARRTLEELLDEDYRVDDMHLYLAQVAEMSGHPGEAIEHYLKVSGGDKRLRGRVQAARLMYKNGRYDDADTLMNNLRDQHPAQAPSLYAAQAEMLSRTGRTEEALAMLDDAIAGLPNNKDLLYARAMVAERLDKLGQVEADLRRVLDMAPDDAVALNALGYTLADHNQRLEEARGYIEQALEKQPDNPAFLDSMGWVLYRQGRPEEALEWLRRAWEKLNDPEIAAHYGEVLWQLDERDKARRIWRDGLEEHPDSDKLHETIERLTGEAP